MTIKSRPSADANEFKSKLRKELLGKLDSSIAKREKTPLVGELLFTAGLASLLVLLVTTQNIKTNLGENFDKYGYNEKLINTLEETRKYF